MATPTRAAPPSPQLVQEGLHCTAKKRAREASPTGSVSKRILLHVQCGWYCLGADAHAAMLRLLNGNAALLTFFEQYEMDCNTAKLKRSLAASNFRCLILKHPAKGFNILVVREESMTSTKFLTSLEAGNVGVVVVVAARNPLTEPWQVHCLAPTADIARENTGGIDASRIALAFKDAARPFSRCKPNASGINKMMEDADTREKALRPMTEQERTTAKKECVVPECTRTAKSRLPMGNVVFPFCPVCRPHNYIKGKTAVVNCRPTARAAERNTQKL